MVTASGGIATFSEGEPHIEVFNDDPPFDTPIVHPFDPMSMWSSTTRDVQPLAKDRWLPLNDTPEHSDIQAFIDCVDTGGTPHVTARDAVHHIEVIMAGYESAASGLPVDL